MGIYDTWHEELYQTDTASYRIRAAPLHRKIVQALSLTPHSAGRLLDVACGKGVFLTEAADISPRIELYGIDISSVAVKESKKLVPQAHVSVSDAESLPFKSGYFSYATCIGGLEYVSHPVNAVTEIARVLKKGGTGVFYVPNLMFIGYIYLAARYGTMPSHGGSSSHKTYYDFMSERFFTLEGWKHVITTGGMKIVSIDRYDNLGSSKYASEAMIRLYDTVLSRFVPKTLAYCYVVTCTR